MKRLLLPLLASLALPTAVHANWLLFGKYKSKIEANEACYVWASKGIKYTYEDMVFTYRGSNDDYGYDEQGNYRKGKLISKKYNANNRYCLLEKETNQYLGYEETAFKKGQHYKEYVYENMDIGLELKKYFKF